MTPICFEACTFVPFLSFLSFFSSSTVLINAASLSYKQRDRESGFLDNPVFWMWVLSITAREKFGVIFSYRRRLTWDCPSSCGNACLCGMTGLPVRAWRHFRVCNWHQKSRAIHFVHILRENTLEFGSYGRAVAKIVWKHLSAIRSVLPSLRAGTIRF